MDRNEEKRMEVVCSSDKALDVKHALLQAGAKCINTLRRECEEVILFCTGTMAMKGPVVNAGAKSFEVAIKPTLKQAAAKQAAA